MIYGTAQLLDPRSVVTRCTGGTVSKDAFSFPAFFPSFPISFFLSLSRIAPLVFFPPFSLRSPVPLLLRYAASAVPRSPSLALSFVSHSEEDVNCLALGPNQYEWPPKRGERETRTTSTTAATTSRPSERASAMLQVMARTTTTGASDGRKEGRKALEAWKEDGRGRCQI